MPDNKVILYSTDGCHLCELASEQLNACGVSYQLVDIAFDDTLFERYGVTIPVVKFNESELNWPFQIEQLQIWLENNGITYHT
ncbi:glutaredoxin family protein [Vibrio sp. SCSIO 43137]|uniref:glutaredoxin family protein n=1 Tax=Vibrio sp. SCSIO 43137 TaxID=3021011 RepID=UPI0023082BF7|nr:glutaredoxin family protein [Vibrio sp. SCSIO 43137]WCE31090.1 glutaredoxin family protein [Vibrio sp. SCSIO 43137]